VAAATDNGHDATKTPQGTFAIGHPEKVIDFGYRAVHDTSVQAKAIATAFYGTAPTRSYFVGCSDGGREALMEAQRFPEDFDGILAACDASDGVKDGLVSNPLACRFDPAVLACNSIEGGDCLTAPQLDTVKALYSGPKNPRTGAQIFSGMVTSGAEAMPANRPLWVLGPAPGRSAQASFGVSYYRDVVFEQPGWELRSMDFDRDVRISDEKVAPIINATNPDLRSFRARGGKLLQYHGWADAAIPGSSSIAYYDAVTSFLASVPDPRSTVKSVGDFYRLFMVPGMAHCSGGVGPVRFGNDATDFGTAPGSADPERDVFTALERWVEQGIEPNRLVGSGPPPGDPAKTMTRPLCPHPQLARYNGSGDIHDAASFSCALPK
jgi:feruloyl esterase